MTVLITTVYAFKFNKALEDTAKLHGNTWSLPLKKAWNAQDSELFLQDRNRFTAVGYRTYWEAVDHTVCYFDSVLLKKQLKNSKSRSKSTSGVSDGDQKDRFRWQNPSYNTDFGPKRVFRQLPLPPPL